MSNTTNIIGLHSSTSYSHAQGYVPAQGFRLSADTANNLGYGIGRAIRGAFDGLWNTWQKMSTSEPTAREVAEQRNTMIYQGGLKECVKQLGPALANLQMNPRDLGALKKVEQLSTHFARYLKPSHQENLRQLQSKILKPLEHRVSAIAHLHIKNALSNWMPVFFQGNNAMKAQTERQRQSQMLQEFPASLTSPEEINQNYYHAYQLTDGARSIFSYLDARLSRLFSIFPAVSAEPVEPDERKVTVLEKDDQSLETARVDTAFIVYITTSEEQLGPASVIAIDADSNKIVANIESDYPLGAIAVTPNSHYAYVALKDGTINVIDTYNNSIVANVKVGAFPNRISITPDGLYAYVTIQSSANVSVIETSSNRVKNIIYVPGQLVLLDIAMTPNGLYAYVTSLVNRSVIVIETVNNTVLTTIDLDKYPYEIAITPDGLYAYVTCHSFGENSSNSISVINTSSNAVIATLPLGRNNYVDDDIAITPNGLYVYVTNRYNKSVIVIDTTNNTVLTTIGVDDPSGGIVVTPDGLYVYVLDLYSLTVINTTSNAVVAKISLKMRFGGIAITPTKIPIPKTENNTAFIIGLSCGGGAFIILLGAGVYLIARQLKKKEEEPAELNSLINPLSIQQKMVFI